MQVVKNSNIVFLTAVFGIALGLRVLFFCMFLQNNPCMLSFDSGHYHQPAVQLVQGNGFSDNQGNPYFYRLPGYSLFLALCYKVFGIDPYNALFVQLLLASLLPLLVFYMSMQFFPAHLFVARISALLTVFHPGFLIFSGLVMTETLFCLCFFSGLILFFRVRDKQRSVASFAVAGILFGCASLVRPIGLPLMLVLAGLLMFRMGWRGGTLLVRLLSGWFFIISCWLLRNWLLTGAIFLHTLPGPHLLNHAAKRVYASAYHISYKAAGSKVDYEVNGLIRQQEAIIGRHLSSLERCVMLEQYAIDILKKAPFQTIMLCVINCIKTLFSLYSSELLFIDSGGQLPSYDNQRGLKSALQRFLSPTVNNQLIAVVIYIEILMHVILLLGMFGFCCYALYYGVYLQQLMIAIALGALFVVLSCVCGFARLRLPIEPFLFMLSIAFFAMLRVGKKGEL